MSEVRNNAMNFEAVKVSMQQNKDGVMLRLAVHPNDCPPDLHTDWVFYRILYSSLIYLTIILGFLYSIKNKLLIPNLFALIGLSIFIASGWVGYTRYWVPSFLCLSLYFSYGFFVLNNAETVSLDKYNHLPTKRVGLTVTEEIIDTDDDSSILDNAQGTSNYAAPGGHRFKLSLKLSALDIVTTTIAADGTETTTSSTITEFAGEKFIELSIDNAVESLPKAKKRDSDFMLGYIEKSIRNDLYPKWGKKPIIKVRLTYV